MSFDIKIIKSLYPATNPNLYLTFIVFFIIFYSTFLQNFFIIPEGYYHISVFAIIIFIPIMPINPFLTNFTEILNLYIFIYIIYSRI